jgi:hypothetical protein
MDEQEFKMQYLNRPSPDPIYRAMKRAFNKLQDKGKDYREISITQSYIKNAMSSIEHGQASDICLAGLLEAMGDLIVHLNKQLITVHQLTVKPITFRED